MRKINTINKRGQGLSTIWLFVFIFAVFFFAMFLGIALYGFNVVNSVFDQDVDVGQVNLREINDITFGKMNSAFLNSADTIGIVVVLGMALSMIFNAYVLGDRSPKLFFVIDVLILVFIFIAAVYLQQTYSIIIAVDPLADTFADDIPRTSTFMLNLPSIVGTLGALIMIFSYISIRRDDRELEVVG